ncbi:MAG: LacI family DNA-binding transcriptional regulator [Candidatus Limnocylindrales bacterium]|jgi:LacI family transcriptional regulator
MAHRKRLTIRDVAAAAGVSIQTVSRVLNNRPDVAPETLQRVQEVIRKTGYAPNMLARSLTQGRSHTLGVVAYGLEYFGPSRVLTAIERKAAEMGYGITLNLFLEPETDAVDHVLHALRARQVDGIIWAIPDVGDNRAWSRTKGSELPVPIMLVGGMAGRPYLPSIVIDNAAIGCLATEHLLAGGARKVGIVTGPLSWWEAQQRLRGWRETLEDHGLEAPDSLIVEGDWTVTSGEQGLYRLLEGCLELDAVFASNDQMALGVLHAAHRLGRRVPDELSVVGVDNIAEASHFWPPLTTVHQPLGDAGAMAVEEIDRLIGKARQPRRSQQAAPEMTLLKPELVVRESARPIVPFGLATVNAAAVAARD